MGAAVGGEQNGARAADNPADLIGRSGASEQIGENAAGLARPGGTSILGEFDQARAASAPNHVRAWRKDQTRIGHCPSNFKRDGIVIAGGNSTGHSLLGRRRRRLGIASSYDDSVSLEV